MWTTGLRQPQLGGAIFGCAYMFIVAKQRERESVVRVSQELGSSDSCRKERQRVRERYKSELVRFHD